MTCSLRSPAVRAKAMDAAARQALARFRRASLSRTGPRIHVQMQRPIFQTHAFLQYNLMEPSRHSAFSCNGEHAVIRQRPWRCVRLRDENAGCSVTHSLSWP